MPQVRTCPKCGAVNACDVMDGLCPLCILGTILEPSSPLATPVAPKTERFFGDYELLEEIGRGGMGVIYKARQAGLDRLVAIKMILGGHFASRESIRRFQAEAQTAARLRHPNIIALHGVGEHDGQHFFSMDFIDGRSLTEVVRDQPLAPSRAARYVQLTSEAIHYAHQQGILHRDLKPSNILIDATDQPRISDFGVAKQIGGDAGLTLTGQLVGSPNYMPPEQAAGLGNIGPWSDVHALGAILYHLVTGRAPFLADTVEQTLQQVLHNEPVSPRILNPTLPRDLETICLKCLEKNPQRRYPSALELAEELSRFLRGEPIRARSVTAWEKGWRWCRRRPAVAALLMTVLLLLVAIAFGSTTTAIRIKRAETLATEKLRDAYLSEARLRRVSGRAGQRFESLEGLRKASSLNPSPALRYQLRNEVIAALAVPDVRWVHTQALAPTPLVQQLHFDRRLYLYARMAARGDVSVRRVSDDVEVASLPSRKRTLYWLHDFSPNGELLAVEYFKGELEIWNLSKKEVVFSGKMGDGGVDFNADNRRLTLIAPAGTLAICDLESRQPWKEIHDVPTLGHARFDPLGTRLVCFNRRTSSVEIRQADTAKLTRSLTMESRVFSDFAWSHNGDLLAGAGESGGVVVWDTQTGERRFLLEGHDARVVRIGFSNHGRLIATTSWDETTRLWDSFTGRPLLMFPGVSYQMQFSPDDRYLAFTSLDERFGLIEIAPQPEFTTLVSNEKTVSFFALSFSPDGRLLANASTIGVNLWDAQTGRILATVQEPGCRTVLFAPDGRSLYTCGLGGLALRRFEQKTDAANAVPTVGARQAILGPQVFMQAALTPDGKWVAVADRREGKARVFAPDNPEMALVVGLHRNIQFVALSPDGQWLATGAWGGRAVKIWDARTGQKVHELPASVNTMVEFSPDGRWLITAGERYQLWKTGSWAEGPTIDLSKKSVPIGYMAFTPDGQMLAVVHAGRELHLLETSTARPLAILATPSEARLSIPRFSPDGTRIACVGGNGQVYLWNLKLIREQLATLGLDWSF